MKARPGPVLLLLVPFLALGGVAQEPSAGKVPLRLNAPKDASFRYQFTLTMDTSMKLGEMDLGTRLESTHDMTVRVLEVNPDGSHLLGFQTGTVRGRMKMPVMGDVEFDSSRKDQEEGENPLAQLLTKALTRLSGRGYRIKASSAGEVLEVQGIEKLMDDSLGDLPGADMVKRMMGDQFSEEGIRHTAESFLSHLPKAPVAVGSSWTSREAMPLSGRALVTELTHTLAKADPKAAEIEFRGSPEVKPAPWKTRPAAKPKEGEEEGDAMATAVEKMDVKNGMMKGTLQVSRQDGLPLRETCEMAYDTIMPNPMGGAAMTAKNVVTMRIERLEGTPASKPAAPGGPGR